MNDIYQVIHLKLGVILVGAVTTMSKVALSSGFEPRLRETFFWWTQSKSKSCDYLQHKTTESLEERVHVMMMMIMVVV